MAIHDIARNLPFLRRFARALTGSAQSGDALVAATLQSLIDGRVAVDRTGTDRAALFAALWHNRATQIALGPAGGRDGGLDPVEAALHTLTPLQRAAFLLVTVEQIDEAEAARILETSPAAVRALVAEVREQLQNLQFPVNGDPETQIRVPNRSG